MRTPRHLSAVLLGLALLMPAVAQSQEASPEPAKLPNAPSTRFEPITRFDIEFGAEAPFFANGDRWTKFVQFRDIPSGFVVSHFDFAVGQDNNRWSLIGSGLDAGQRDQRYRLELEKFGVSRSLFRFNSFPNFISRGVTSPYAEISPGVYTLPTALRQAFEDATDDPTRISLVNDLVANTAHSTLQGRRQQFLFDQDFRLTKHLFINANVMYDRRTGHRPIGVGAYNRTGGALGAGATWLTFEDELPEHVDYRTTEVRFGVGYQGHRGMVRFDYTGSWFGNNVKNLVFVNPYEVTACAATPGVCPIAAAPGTSGRWRFDQEQIYTNPDNHANTFTVQGRVKLPADSFFSALMAYSMRRQDSAFDPFTLSSAVFPGAPAADMTDPALLPQSSLHGEVNTTTGNAVLGTRHWRHLLLTARYRAFNYDNQTPIVALPGIIDMGSFWTTAFDGTPVTAFEVPSSYLRQNVSFEAVWRPNRHYQFRATPTLETWNRTRRQVSRLNEWGGDAAFIAQPSDWFNAKITYHYGDRILESAYDPAPNEFVELRDFDQAHRITNNPTIVLNFGGKGAWLASANYSYLSQAYDQNFFGLGKYLRGAVGAELNYAPGDRWGVAGYYSHERIGYHYRNIAKENVDSAETFVLPSDEWDRATRDKVDSFGVAFHMLSANQRWEFGANYDFSFANQTIHTTNPLGTPAFPIDATGRNFPDVNSHFQEVFLDTSYKFGTNWRAGVRYVFSPYQLEDFATDNVTPYMPTQSATPAPGTTDPQTNGVRFLVLDSRYASADMHMIGAYLRYSFW